MLESTLSNEMFFQPVTGWAANPSDDAAVQKKYQVMVVDDDPVVSRVVECILDDFCDCYFVGSGLEAYLQAAERQPDLILLDVMLPGINGYDVCQQLKNDPSTSSIPIVFLTSRSDFHDERLGLRLGAVDFLNKPLTPDLLRLRIRNQLHSQADRRQLHRESRQDALTGIGNRRVLDDALNTVIPLAKQKQCSLILFLLDIDHFKSFNDCFGHWAGDQALKQVATAIRDQVNQHSGLVARYGGEEFACIFTGLLPEEAEQVAQRLCSEVEHLGIESTDQSVAGCLTASLGGVYLPPGYETSKRDLIIEADQLLYQAKRSGRNRYSFKAAQLQSG